MRKIFEIYYRHLNENAKARFNAEFGDPETYNWDILPLAIFEQEDEDDDEEEK